MTKPPLTLENSANAFIKLQGQLEMIKRRLILRKIAPGRYSRREEADTRHEAASPS